MHATEIIGWTFDGAMYCTDHKPDHTRDARGRFLPANKRHDEPHPVFASDEIDPLDACDTCLHKWISENPGKNATDARALVFLDQDAAETAIRNAVMVATFNRFSIYMSREAMEDCSHSGSCDSDVSHWAPKVQAMLQNKEISPEDIRAELKEYGAWEVSELEDDSTNWERIVWCAACNLKDERES